MNEKRIYTLDLFRIVFILIIFFSHTILGSDLGYGDVGTLGTSFFIILSGFLLAGKQVVNIDIGSCFRFSWNHIKKLYPIHIFTFLVSVPLHITSNLLIIPCAVANLLLIQTMIPLKAVYFSFNSVSWFLSLMAILYFVFPVIHSKIILLTKRKQIILFIIIVLLEIIYTLINAGGGYQHYLVYIFPLFRVLDFILGIILKLLLKNIEVKNISDIWFSILEIYSIIILSIQIIFFKQVPDVITYVIYSLPSVIIIIGVFCFEKGIISKLINKFKLYSLGRYVMYFFMIHQLVIIYINYLNRIFKLDILVLLVIELLASCLISYVIVQKRRFWNGKVKTIE